MDILSTILSLETPFVYNIDDFTIRLESNCSGFIQIKYHVHHYKPYIEITVFYKENSIKNFLRFYKHDPEFKFLLSKFNVFKNQDGLTIPTESDHQKILSIINK